MTQAKYNVAALELMGLLGVSNRKAWLIKQDLIEAMRRLEDTSQLTGRLETDGAYLRGGYYLFKRGRGSPN